MPKGAAPRDFAMLMPVIEEAMHGGISLAFFRQVAEREKWSLYDSDSTSLAFAVNQSIGFFVTEGDPAYVDHACFLTWTAAPSIESMGRPDELDAVFRNALIVAQEKLGSPELQGIWDGTVDDCYRFGYKYAIWRHGLGIVVIQQDDSDPQSGLDVNICLQRWPQSAALPQTRRWRYREKPS